MPGLRVAHFIGGVAVKTGPWPIARADSNYPLHSDLVILYVIAQHPGGADRKVLNRRGGKFAKGGCHVAVGTPGRLRQLIKVVMVVVLRVVQKTHSHGRERPMFDPSYLST